MVALFYMLDTSRVNEKTISCLKHKEDILKFSSYDFGWNLAKAYALPDVCREKLHSLMSTVPLKMKMFVRIALEVSLSQSQTSKTDTSVQAKREYVKYTRISLEIRVKKIIPQCPKSNASHVVKVLVEHIL